MADALPFVRGADETYSATLRAADNSVIDLTDYTAISAELWYRSRDREGVVGDAIVSVADPTSGEVLISIGRDVTSLLPLGKVPWIRLYYTTPSGQRKIARIDLEGSL